MKGTLHKRSTLGLLCALLVALILYVPNVVEAAELTATANKTKEFAGSENGEVIYLTLSGAGTNTKLMGKPSWVTSSGSGSKYTLKTSKNTSTSSRKGDIVILDGKKTYTLRITQKGAPTSVTVKFNNNGGKGKVPNKSYKIGKTYGKLPAGSTPPTGKKFAGWYTKPSGGTKITEKSKVSASITVLYAHYTNKSYTVKFDSRGGSKVSSKTVTYGTNYGKLTTPKKTGYNFKGWFTAASGGKQVTEKTKMSSAVGHTLYAHWTPATYTITFDSQGGSSVPSRNVAYNGTYGELRTPSRDGYTFLGWFTAAKGGTQVTSSTKLTKAAKQTLYAQWKGGSITVHFDNNGGYGDVPNKGYTVEQKYGSLPAGTTGPKGYGFAGWFTARTGGTKITKDSIVSADNKTLYAQYKAKVFTLSFNSVGGSAVSSRNVTYDSKYGDLPIPKKYGYKFVGWFTAEKGGDEITKNSVVNFASNHTLYAHWKYNMVSVRFDNNGGNGNVPNRDYEIGTKYNSLPSGTTPSNKYLIFDGWYTAKTGGTKITANSIVPNASITLYAHYVVNPDAFFLANPQYKKSDSPFRVPRNKSIEREKEKGKEGYEKAFDWNIYKTLFNKKGLERDEYVKDVWARARVLLKGVDLVGTLGAKEGAELFNYYLYGNGGMYEFDAFPLLNDGDYGTETFNNTANSLMRNMEKFLTKGKEITFVDVDSSNNSITFDRFKNLNGFFAMHGGSYGVSGSCTYDGSKYKMDLYFYLQDHYDFLYKDGHWQAKQWFFTLRVGELAYLVPYGYATPFEACGIFHSTIEWTKGQEANLSVSSGKTSTNKSKYAKITRIKGKHLQKV